MSRLYAVLFVLMLLVAVYVASIIGSPVPSRPPSLLTQNAYIYAIDDAALPITKSEQNISTKSADQYILPYPGILPDHPLYPLKKLRDSLLNFLIKDPIKRIDFNLLMADKRINMTVYLIDKENRELAEKTAVEGREYFIKALESVSKAKEAGRDVSKEYTDKLSQANNAHDLIIQNLIKQNPENLSNIKDTLMQSISSAREQLDQFSN